MNENRERRKMTPGRGSLPELLFLGLLVLSTCRGESLTCLTVYKEGGAPAVFQSPKCPRWELPNSYSVPGRCQTAAHQGRRSSMEDHTLCALDIRIPFPGETKLKEVLVSIVAVFDGHNGAEASDMASKLLLEYFALHTYFLLDATYSIAFKKPKERLPKLGEDDIAFQGLNWDDEHYELDQQELNLRRFKFSLPPNVDEFFHLQILKEALLRAIDDIDETFSKQAYKNGLDSGSTATIVLMADSQILVANIGDSKAFLCSDKFQTPSEARATMSRVYKEHKRAGQLSPSRDYDYKLATTKGLSRLIVKELTNDHHPDRDDERVRVEAAGGYVLKWADVARVNGELAVSRAIGDVSYKRYGVISVPEVTDWQPLTANDSYLVAASDGVFEKLSLQDVCDLLWEVNRYGGTGLGLSSSCSFLLADCLVKTAFEKGSMDNMAAIVVPLGSNYSSQNYSRDGFDEEGDVGGSATRHKNLNYEISSNLSSDLVQLKHAHPLTTKLSRLLVEGTHGEFSCFYLSENLDDKVDDTLQIQEDVLEDFVYDLPHALPRSSEPSSSGLLNLYREQSSCLHFGMSAGDSKDKCPNHDGFASFLALLESIPFHDFGSNDGPYTTPDSRYVLKRRFGRGAYGEVWLAFQGNCQQSSNASSWSMENKITTFSAFHSDPTRSSPNNESRNDTDTKFFDKMFILKRIMVEKGPAVYLSGLREKHFGEVFLNASMFGTSNSGLDSENVWSFGNTFSKNFAWQEAVFEEGLNHLARYVESFESRSNDIWLVFRHEGVSLSKVMYTVDEPDKNNVEEQMHSMLLSPSKWWHWLKTSEGGQEEMRDIIWQLLMAVKSCHDRNITHRDIKPENMVICFQDEESGRCLNGVPNGDSRIRLKTKLRIIDFGSAIDDFTMKHLYGSSGPSKAEQTHDYAPPEAILYESWYKGPTETYDMWSIGVVFLEMILGSPNVFQINDVTRALLDNHLVGWNENLKEVAYRLRSLMELCILIPGTSAGQGGSSPASWKCSEEFFSDQIKRRDPLHIGFPNIWALRLVRRLLLWDPQDRLSVNDALHHPYFHRPNVDQ